jgi:hypothetical protein
MPIQNAATQQRPKASAPITKRTQPAQPSQTSAKAPSKPKPPTQANDRVEVQRREAASNDPRGFSSFLNNVQGAFGQVTAATRPLDFTEQEQREGIKSADTVSRLAGPDQTWSSDDLANNLAQLQTGRGLRGSVERSVAQGSLFKTHGVPEDQQAPILERSQQIREGNPNIANLHKLEQADLTKISDPEKRSKYQELKEEWTQELSRKGLLPVGISDLKQLGSASGVLKEKLQERGLPVSEGQPVNVNQFRGLFEGKAPLATQFGL